MTEPMEFQATGGRLVRVNMASGADLMAALEPLLRAGTGFSVATLNLDHLVKLAHDEDFAAAYCAQTHVVADGRPVAWLSRLAGRPVRVAPGSELVEPLAALAAAQNVPLALLGATDATLDAAGDHLQRICPGLSIATRIAPAWGYDPMGAQAADDLAAIDASGAGLCFLALGAPKQEILAARGAELAPGCGFVSIGAGLDFLAGSQVRAPLWARRIAMEWFWRMMQEPRRMVPRYAACGALLPRLALDAWRLRRR